MRNFFLNRKKNICCSSPLNMNTVILIIIILCYTITCNNLNILYLDLLCQLTIQGSFDNFSLFPGSKMDKGIILLFLDSLYSIGAITEIFDVIFGCAQGQVADVQNLHLEWWVQGAQLLFQTNLQTDWFPYCLSHPTQSVNFQLSCSLQLTFSMKVVDSR